MYKYQIQYNRELEWETSNPKSESEVELHLGMTYRRSQCDNIRDMDMLTKHIRLSTLQLAVVQTVVY